MQFSGEMQCCFEDQSFQVMIHMLNVKCYVMCVLYRVGCKVVLPISYTHCQGFMIKCQAVSLAKNPGFDSRVGSFFVMIYFYHTGYKERHCWSNR